MHVQPLSKIEEVYLWCVVRKGLLSIYYNLLISTSKDSAIDRLNAWRDDSQENITEIDWNEACLKAQTINTTLKLLRTYMMPVKLHYISQSIPDICTRRLSGQLSR